jgi:hypothetical protein
MARIKITQENENLLDFVGDEDVDKSYKPTEEFTGGEKVRLLSHGALKGWEDEALAAGKTGFEALIGKVPLSDIPNRYFSRRLGEQKKYEDIKKKNELGALGYEIGGGAVNPITFNPWLDASVTAAGEAKHGLEDIPKFIGETAVGTAVGGTLGKVMHGLGGFVGSSLKDKQSAIADKASKWANVVLDLPEHIGQKYFKNPTKFDESETIADVGKQLFTHGLPASKKGVQEGSQASREILRETAPDIGNTPVLEAIGESISDLHKRYPRMNTPGAEKEFAEQLGQQKKLLEKLEYYETVPDITPDEIKTLAQDLQNSGIYSENLARFTQTPQTNKAAGSIKRSLEEASPEYQEKMLDVAERTRLNKFLEKIGQDEDAFISSLTKTVTNPLKHPSKLRKYKRIDELLNTNFVDRAEHALARDALTKATTQGSKGVVTYTNIAKSFLGDKAGGIVGPIVGMIKDRSGRKAAMKALEIAKKISDGTLREPGKKSMAMKKLLQNPSVENMAALQILEKMNESEGEEY